MKVTISEKTVSHDFETDSTPHKIKIISFRTLSGHWPREEAD